MYRLALEGFIRNLIGNTCTLLLGYSFAKSYGRVNAPRKTKTLFFHCAKSKLLFICRAEPIYL